MSQMREQTETRWSKTWAWTVAAFLRPTARPWHWGVATAVVLLAAETLVVVALQRVAGDAFGAVFLLGVLVVSGGWGFGLAVPMSLASAFIYVLFHAGSGADSLVPALLVFLVLSLLVNLLAGQARLRAEEADQRRREADLAAELARVMLRADALPAALRDAGRRMAEVLALRFVVLTLGTDSSAGPAGSSSIPLFDGTSPLGTLFVADDLDRAGQRRVLRMVASVETLLAAAAARQSQLRESQRDIEAGHARVAALAAQQTALRRVATLVASDAEPEEVFPAAVLELARGLQAEHVTLLGFVSDDRMEVLATHDLERTAHFTVGEILPLESGSVSGTVSRTGRPARVDDYGSAVGELAARLSAVGLRSGVGVPVVVDGRVRAALIMGSAAPQPLPAETEARIVDFADLIATSMFHSETRSEIAASRSRVVAAADQARRGFERDLHDGAQQRIVSLGLQLRMIEAGLPAADGGLKKDLGLIVDGLGGLYSDLQELSRGLHPAVLSKGGLGPALKMLGRRSTVPVVLELPPPVRLPESVEVAAYYFVAEALTNTAKHATATEVHVTATVVDASLVLRISDDGIGGARSDRGSGLVGLRDRVEALSGQLDVVSPVGGGTALTATIPTGALPAGTP